MFCPAHFRLFWTLWLPCFALRTSAFSGLCGCHVSPCTLPPFLDSVLVAPLLLVPPLCPCEAAAHLLIFTFAPPFRTRATGAQAKPVHCSFSCVSLPQPNLLPRPAPYQPGHLPRCRGAGHRPWRVGAAAPPGLLQRRPRHQRARQLLQGRADAGVLGVGRALRHRDHADGGQERARASAKAQQVGRRLPPLGWVWEGRRAQPMPTTTATSTARATTPPRGGQSCCPAKNTTSTSMHERHLHSLACTPPQPHSPPSCTCWATPVSMSV
eukprot:353906-Chlamydomonas_euryale.AAC.4